MIFDLRNQLVESCENFVTLWLRQLHDQADRGKQSSINIVQYSEISPAVQEYFIVFLKGCYLKHFDELSKKRPTVAESTMWIGDNSLLWLACDTDDFREGQVGK